MKIRSNFYKTCILKLSDKQPIRYFGLYIKIIVRFPLEKYELIVSFNCNLRNFEQQNTVISNREDAWRLSPQNFLKEIAQQSQHRHIVLAVGEYDPPEFRRQSGEMEKVAIQYILCLHSQCNVHRLFYLLKYCL